ncbi:MAG: Glycosyl transferase family 39 [Candidatus Woesebacteria bacterium GW2011_GWA1_39_12]|uniref:Glycosyl transferase family 39 n=2 Tax=Candidatus Woeseibacteriota TaxID=1752722 RepID=A0A0G0M1F0_9BACT|nr:MAG: Glycosyl transferase family 39 [Candidatus Woesebacteria bacterium GW2011_GWA1_39_12]
MRNILNKLVARVISVKRIEYYLLALILVGGFIVRLYKIDNPIADWHSFRQADTAAVARLYVENGVNILYPRYYDLSSTQSRILNPEGYRYVEFPLYNAIHAVLAKNIGVVSFEVWGRLVSIIFTLGSGFILYFLGARFMNKWGGVLASFFFLFLPFNIYFTRVILPEPTAIFFGLLGIWLFILFIDKDKAHFLYLSGVSIALGLLVKPFIIFYTIPLIYLISKKYSFRKIFQNPKLLIKLLIFVDIILVPFFVWRAWISKFPAGIPGWSWMFNGDGIRLKPAFFRWIFGERLTKLILGFWGIIIFVFGLLKPKKDLFTHAFLLGMLIYVVVFATANVRHDYYQAIAIPAISLTLAEGLIYLWNSRDFPLVATRSVAIFSILIMFTTGASEVREFYKVNHPEIMEAGAAVDRLTPKDAIVIAPYNGDTAFLYQTKRRGWPVIDSSVDEIIQKGADYYVTVSLNDPDTLDVIARFEVVEKTNTYLIADLHKPIK